MAGEDQHPTNEGRPVPPASAPWYDPAWIRSLWARRGESATAAPPTDGRSADRRCPEEMIGLFQKIGSGLLAQTNPDVELELARLLELLNRIEQHGFKVPHLYERADFAASALLAPMPKLTIARSIRSQLHLEVSARYAGWPTRQLIRITDGSPTVIVVIGLITATVVCLLLMSLIIGAGSLDEFGRVLWMDAQAVATVSIAAFLGGAISILTRLHRFSEVYDVEPFFMFWTAALKPLVSVVLGVFVLALLMSGIINLEFLSVLSSESASTGAAVQEGRSLLAAGPPASDTPVDPGRRGYVWWVIGFLAGFSERFAWDLVSDTEGKIRPLRKSDDKAPA